MGAGEVSLPAGRQVHLMLSGLIFNGIATDQPSGNGSFVGMKTPEIFAFTLVQSHYENV